MLALLPSPSAPTFGEGGGARARGLGSERLSGLVLNPKFSRAGSAPPRVRSRRLVLAKAPSQIKALHQTELAVFQVHLNPQAKPRFGPWNEFLFRNVYIHI